VDDHWANCCTGAKTGNEQNGEKEMPGWLFCKTFFVGK